MGRKQGEIDGACETNSWNGKTSGHLAKYREREKGREAQKKMRSQVSTWRGERERERERERESE